jgi:hypothetical protein
VVFPAAWQDASRVCACPGCLCRNRSADRRELSPRDLGADRFEPGERHVAVEDRCAFPDGLSRRVDSRAVRDFARGGRGRRRPPRSDLLRRDDGRSAQMWRASAKVACGCSSLIGARHHRQAKRPPNMQCRQANLAIQMARFPRSSADRRRCGDRESDRVSFVRISPSKR